MPLAITFAPHAGATDVTFALRIICGATVVWLVAAVVAWGLRRSAGAAVRHRVWSLACVAAIGIPALLPVLPEWRLGPVSKTAAAPPMLPANTAKTPPAPRVDVDHAFDAHVDALAEPSVNEPPVTVAIAPPMKEDRKPVASQGSTAERLIGAAPYVARPIPWRTIVWGAWAVPAFWLTLRQVRSLHVVYRLVRKSPLITGQDDFGHLSRRLGIDCPPAIAERADISSPICVGLIRPAVLLPSGWRSWSPARLQAVMTHELAHVARRDVAWQMVARLAAAVYWFHPLAWVAAWRMRVERELACDDWVLRGGQPSSTYARWLLEIAASAAAAAHLSDCRRFRVGAAGVAMAAGNGLERRVAAILDMGRRRTPVSRRVAAGLALAALTLGIAIGVINPWAPRAVAADATPAKSDKTDEKTDPDTRVLTLAGRVEDDRGQPVSGAFVMIDSGLFNEQVRCDGGGRFSLTLRNRRDRIRYVNVRATTVDGSRQTFRQLYDPEGDGQITDEQAGNVRLVLRPAREFPITVIDRRQQPVADAWIAFSASYCKAGEARTDATGKAVLRVPADAPPMHVMASKAGTGLDYVEFWRPEETRTDPYRLAPDYKGPIKFVLDGAKTVTIKVVDEQERPLPNVRVHPWVFSRPKRGGDFNQGIPELARRTGADGVATFDYIPADLNQPLTFWTYLDGYSSPRRCTFDPKNPNTALDATLLKNVHVAGRVVDENGRPAPAGVTVRYLGDGYSYDPCFGTKQTRADGTFEVDVDADKYYMFTADGDRLAAKPVLRVVHRKSPAPVELVLKPGTRLFGRATIGSKGDPMPDASISLTIQDNNSYANLPADEQLPAPGNGEEQRSITPHLFRNIKADANGAFEVYVAPGNYTLNAYAPALRLWANAQAKVGSQPQLEVNLRTPQDAVARKTLRGRVVRGDNPAVAVPFATLSGQSLRFQSFTAVADKDGNFTIEHGADDLYLSALSEDKQLRGFTTVHAADPNVTLTVAPAASATGRLLDHTGTPVAGREIQFGYRIGTPKAGFTDAFGGTTTTAADGTFVVEGLVPGYEYHVSAVSPATADGTPRGWQNVAIVKADGPTRVDLGDRKLPRPYTPNQTKSWKEREAEAFAPLDPIDQRLADARERARVGRRRVLVVLGGPGRPGCDEFFEFANDPAHYDVRRPLADYVVVAVDTLLNETDALAWAERAGVPWPAPGMTLAVLDADAKVIDKSLLKPLTIDGKLSRKPLIEFLTRNAPPTPTATPAANALPLHIDAARTGFIADLKLPPLSAVTWRIRTEPSINGGRLNWPSITDPIVAAGVVYFGDDRGILRAVHSADGRPVWSHEEGQRINAATLDEDRIYFTTRAGVGAVNRADGKPAWQFDVEGGASEAGGVVWPATDTLFYGGCDGFLYALDRRTGKPNWKFSLTADAPADPPGFPGARARIGSDLARPTGVATDGVTVFQSVFDQSRVVAVDAKTGEKRWSFQARGWIHPAPTVGDRHVYVGSQDRNVYCLDKRTGEKVWSFPTNGRVESRASLADGRLYIASCDGVLYCLDAENGKPVWSYPTEAGDKGNRAIYSAPIVTADAVYFAAGEGQLYAIDRAGGKLLYKLRPSETSELFTNPATDGTRIFLTTRASFDQSGESSVIAVGP